MPKYIDTPNQKLDEWKPSGENTYTNSPPQEPHSFFMAPANTTSASCGGDDLPKGETEIRFADGSTSRVSPRPGQPTRRRAVVVMFGERHEWVRPIPSLSREYGDRKGYEVFKHLRANPMRVEPANV